MSLKKFEIGYIRWNDKFSILGGKNPCPTRGNSKISKGHFQHKMVFTTKMAMEFDIFLIFFEFLIGHWVDELHRTDKIDFVKKGKRSRSKIGNKTVFRKAFVIVPFDRLSILTKSLSLSPLDIEKMTS